MRMRGPVRGLSYLPMPDIAVVTLKGESLTTNDFAGKVVLFDFWGTW